jgi:hypothetical protein
MLREMADTGERRTQGGDSEGSTAKLSKLADLGVTKTQSSRWQKLAAMDDDDFDAHVARLKKQAVRSVEATAAERAEGGPFFSGPF